MAVLVWVHGVQGIGGMDCRAWVGFRGMLGAVCGVLLRLS